MTNKAETASRRKLKIAFAVIIVLAFVSLIAAFLISRYLIPSQNEAITEWAAKAAPADTQLFFAGNLAEVGVPYGAQAEFVGNLLKSKHLDFLNQELFADSGLTLKDDILPWMIPEAALAAKLSVDNSASAAEIGSEEQGAVSATPDFSAALAIRVRDLSAAKSAMQKVRQSFEKNGFQYKTERLFDCDVSVSEKGPAWTFARGYLYFGLKSQDLGMLLAERAKGEALADNSEYKDALKRFKTTQGAVFFCNISDILSSLSLYDQIKSERLRSFVKSLRYAAAGAGVLDKKRVSGAYLAADPKTMGEIGKLIFNNSYNIRFDSFDIHPKESDMYAGVNIKMLWDYSVILTQDTEDGFPLADFFVMLLSKNGIDFDKDILGNLTGELAYSCVGCGKAQAENTVRAIMDLKSADGAADSAMQSVDAFSKMPVLVSIGYKDKKKFDDICEKIEPLKQLMLKANSEKCGDTSVYSAGTDVSSPYFAFTKQAFLLELNNNGKKIKNYLENGNSGALSQLPAFSTAGFLDPDKTAAAVAYQDLGRFYGDMADTMAQEGTVEDCLIDAIKGISNLYGVQYGQLIVRSDGLSVTSVVELK